MRCDVCGENVERLTILPIKNERTGTLETLACTSCARESSAFCANHNRAHLGYADRTTACLQCIDEMVELERENAFRIFESLRVIAPKGFAEVRERIEDDVAMGGGDKEIFLMRLFATKALRSGKSFDDTLEQAYREKDISFLLT